MSISFKPIWFDSLGAKSSCTLIETDDLKILIDPGVAGMQPSFPATKAQKNRWKSQGRGKIRNAMKRADLVIISHYHYDHFEKEDLDLYRGKILFAKNPNEFINLSQRKRAEDFYRKICMHFGSRKLEDLLKRPVKKRYRNPLLGIPLAVKKDFGDYTERRRELFRRGIERFSHLKEEWNGISRIPEFYFEDLEVRFPEGSEVIFGKTRLRFTDPLFHGVEFSKVGWVFATVVERAGEKIIHSSDLNGPIIEDYANWLVEENPDILILDGPMTYMLGYMLNKINLKRVIQNVIRILEETETRLILYDHHLPREPKFREHTPDIWVAASKSGKKIMTVAEFLGKTPKVLETI